MVSVERSGSIVAKKMIDLHSHTNISDGELTPEELVQLALKRNLSALAITDHDQVKAIPPAREVANGTDLEIISGVEVSSSKDGNTLHILGLFVDENHAGLVKYLEDLRKRRISRAEKMVERLGRSNINITLDEILTVAKGGTVGRPHVAKVLIQKGFVRSTTEAFDRYLASGRPGFVPYEKAAPQPAIDMIHAAGGLSFLAHPGLVRNQDLIHEVVDMGIDGLEVIHPDHSKGYVKRYREMCEELDLLMSGGSDYHGPHAERKGDLGKMEVPYNFLDAMKVRLD